MQSAVYIVSEAETESIMIVSRAGGSHLHISSSAETPPWMTVLLEHSVSPPGGEIECRMEGI